MRSRLRVNSAVFSPSRAAVIAASQPAWPPPTTITNYRQQAESDDSAHQIRLSIEQGLEGGVVEGGVDVVAVLGFEIKDVVGSLG